MDPKWSPVPLDDHTLIYSATADDGTGPWLYVINVDDRVPQRMTTGIEHYMSIAASADNAGRPATDGRSCSSG